MLTKEQLDELKEMLSNGDHPTKRHRADLLLLVKAELNQPDEELLQDSHIWPGASKSRQPDAFLDAERRVALSWFTDLDTHEVVIRLKAQPEYMAAMPDKVARYIFRALKDYRPCDQIEAIIAQVRHRDQATPWRAACDEIMDRVRRLFDET